MCRIAAYIGPAIPMENIVTLPRHSLLAQSQQARQAVTEVNGDGFGIAWYSSDQPSRFGLFRDVLPAWSDENLTSLCHSVCSGLFMAHVRAATQGETARWNCHPFSADMMSFMHNGGIGGFQSIRRQIEQQIPDKWYHQRCGNTDSEILFLLIAHYRQQHPPLHAIAHAIAHIEDLQLRQGIDITGKQPNRITCAFSEGKELFAVRYASDRKSPSLYHCSRTDHGGQCLASEPIDDLTTDWHTILDGQAITLGHQLGHQGHQRCDFVALLSEAKRHWTSGQSSGN